MAFTSLLFQAYQWMDWEKKTNEMPVTSYMIKTTLFFIIDGTSDFQIIRDALKYSSAFNQEALQEPEAEVCKLKFNPKPKWITEEDISRHAEDARVMSIRIFRFIHYLAKLGCRVPNYWRPSMPDYGYLGEASYVSEICECVLERLKKDHYY